MSTTLDFQCTSKNPSVVGGSGTIVKYFPKVIGASITSPATTPNATNPNGALWIPASPAFDGRQFIVRCSGSVSEINDPSGTLQFGLYAVTGTLTNPIYTLIAGDGPQTSLLPAAQPWSLEVNLLGDTVSGLLGGTYLETIGGVPAFTSSSFLHPVRAVMNGLDFVNGNPSLQRGAALGLVVGMTFGTSDPSNTARMTQFTVEAS